MKVTAVGLTSDDLLSVVEHVSKTAYAHNLTVNRFPERRGKWLHFTLRVNSSRGPGARISHSGHRLVAACWHAHRDVMRELFFRFPGARLVSAAADYRGLDSFNTQFEGTGYQNIGSVMFPLAYADACACGTNAS